MAMSNCLTCRPAPSCAGRTSASRSASFAWSRDLRTVAVSGNDNATDSSGRVALLDPQTLETRSLSAGPQTAGGLFVAYSPNGDRFVTASAGRMSLWEATTARLIGSLLVEGADGAGFAADTNDVLIASTVPEVSAWDPRPQAAVEAACRLAGRDLTKQEWQTYLPNRPYSSAASTEIQVPDHAHADRPPAPRDGPPLRKPLLWCSDATALWSGRTHGGTSVSPPGRRHERIAARSAA